jgi:phosphoribosylformylglycinamidine cyclo-ligase
LLGGEMSEHPGVMEPGEFDLVGFAVGVVERAGRDPHGPAWPGAHHSLIDELLVPSVIYAPAMQKVMSKAPVHAFAHVTGGGIPGNLVRILPENVDAVVDRSSWRPQSIFDLIQAKGRIEDTEMEATFNMGVGMFAIVSSDDADRAMAYLTGRGVEAWQVGEVIDGTGEVQMMGQYTRG